MTALPDVCPACGEPYLEILGPGESTAAYPGLDETSSYHRVADEHDTWAQHTFYHE